MEDLYQSETDPHVAEFIASKLQIDIEQANLLHLNMLIYTIGIGTIFASTSPGISADEIFAKQENAYEAFINQVLNSKRSNK